MTKTKLRVLLRVQKRLDEYLQELMIDSDESKSDKAQWKRLRVKLNKTVLTYESLEEFSDTHLCSQGGEFGEIVWECV